MTAKPDAAHVIGAASRGKSKVKYQEYVAVAPALEAMPIELIENITQYLSLREFGTCRLSSRMLRDKSTYYFIKRFFEKRTIELEWESLRRLAIIESRELLGPAIKHLVVKVEEEGHFCSMNTQMSNVGIVRRTGPNYADRPGTIIQDFGKARQVEMMLDRILDRLPLLASLAFEVQKPPRLGAAFPDGNAAMSSLAISLVLASVASCGTKIQSLYIGGECDNGAGSYIEHHRDIENVIASDAMRLKRAFRSLKLIELSWGPWRHYPNDDETTFSSETNFPNSLLKMAPDLETLILRDPRYENHSNQSTYLDYFRVPLPKLKSLKLYDPNFTASDRDQRHLKGFIKKYANNLKEVYIGRLSSSAVGQAAAFARTARDELELEKFEIDMTLCVSGG
jgi:hypothetical protein